MVRRFEITIEVTGGFEYISWKPVPTGLQYPAPTLAHCIDYFVDIMIGVIGETCIHFCTDEWVNFTITENGFNHGEFKLEFYDKELGTDIIVLKDGVNIFPESGKVFKYVGY